MKIMSFSYDEVKRRLDQLQSRLGPWAGTVYRNCIPQYATNKDLLAGAGSSLNGGRWNPAGIRAVYASLTPETSMAEALSHFRYYGINVADAMPRVFVAIQVKLTKLLDLTAPDVRRSLKLPINLALHEDWRKVQCSGAECLSQMIGRAAAAVGLEGLIVPSDADPSGKNLVCFPDNLAAKSKLVVHRADELPK
jgi:RES domain-containing protein